MQKQNLDSVFVLIQITAPFQPDRAVAVFVKLLRVFAVGGQRFVDLLQGFRIGVTDTGDFYMPVAVGNGVIDEGFGKMRGVGNGRLFAGSVSEPGYDA